MGAVAGNQPDMADAAGLEGRPQRPAASAQDPRVQPRSPSDPRSHADGVEPAPLLAFLKRIAADTAAVDVMIEAKAKDGALFELMETLKGMEGPGSRIIVLDGASISIEA